MPSLTITTRTDEDGPRYVVRYRLGGRAYPLVHGGSFKTMKEAKARRDLVAGEIAAGRNPADTLRAMVEQPKRRTFARVGRGVPGEPRRHRRRDGEEHAAPPEADAADVQRPRPGHDHPGRRAGVDRAGSTLKPSSTRRYLATLRAVLDFAGVDPNPARDSRVRLPREERRSSTRRPRPTSTRSSPTSPKRWRLPLRVLEQTGMRVGELAALAWGDVDEQGSRFRIKARQDGRGPPLGRGARVADGRDRRDGARVRTARPSGPCSSASPPDVAKNVMARACKAAGIVAPAPARPAAPLREREDRRGRPGDDRRGAARTLAEEPDAGHVLARSARKRGIGRCPGVVSVWPGTAGTPRKPTARAKRPFTGRRVRSTCARDR